MHSPHDRNGRAPLTAAERDEYLMGQITRCH